MKPLEALTSDQLAFYRQQGYVILENRVPMSVIEAIRDEIARFQEEARSMTASNDRLDLEDSHTRESPRVRRIKRPDRISEPVANLLNSDAILAPARDLLGPNVRLQTTKLNMKSAGFGAAIEWHQDFAFYPHTNDDVLAIGVLIDDLLPENGPLMVFPGSHRGPIYNHHANGVFAGAIDLAVEGLDPAQATALTGPAGSITIHHGRIVHGSSLNRADYDRRLLFYEMMAADAFPLMGGNTEFATIEEYDGLMLCGEPTLEPRLEAVPVRIPRPLPKTLGSIYEIQKAAANRSFAQLQ